MSRFQRRLGGEFSDGSTQAKTNLGCFSLGQLRRLFWFSGGDPISWDGEHRKRNGFAGGGDFWRREAEVPRGQLSGSSQ